MTIVRSHDSNTYPRAGGTGTAVSTYGTIFDIERYATKDGPGIRTAVFFKGCALKCLWCANPESQIQPIQVSYQVTRCTVCGRCMEACPVGAIRRDADFGFLTLSDFCSACGECVDACVFGAREMVGRVVTVETAMETILRDRLFYQYSNGGVTITGGEPLLQSAFAAELLHSCRDEGIHTAMETSGFAPRKNLAEVLDGLQLIYFDIKSLDPEKHKAFTGASNRIILENFEFLCREFNGEKVIRIPFVPGFNDSEREIAAILEYLAPYRRSIAVEVMPFHSLGSAKYRSIGRTYHYAGQASLRGRLSVDVAGLGRRFGLRLAIVE